MSKLHTCFFCASDKNFDPNVHLSYTDVMVDNREKPQYITVRIKASKTDPFHKGTRIYFGSFGDRFMSCCCDIGLYGEKGKSSGPNVSIPGSPTPNTSLAGHRT